MNDTKKPGKAPTLIAYSVREFTTKDGEVKSAFTRVGAAWMHKSAEGFRLKLEAIPSSFEIVLLKNKPKDAAPEEEADASQGQ